MPLAVPWKFAAKINVREKKFELDFPPCKKEFELFSVRYDLGVRGKNEKYLSLSTILNESQKSILVHQT